MVTAAEEPEALQGSEAVTPEDLADIFSPIYFDYNRYKLGEQALNQLTKIAKHMTENPGSATLVQGHCDERGSDEYNLALGEKRADMIRNYLVRYGVKSERVNIISYGEERPAVMGSSGDAYSKNRRAQFEVRNAQ